MEPRRPHPRERHLAEVRDWARGVLDPASTTRYVAVDTETTGLDGQIIQLGVLDMRGNVLLDCLVQPTIAVSPEARAVHNIDDEQLAMAATWSNTRRILLSIANRSTMLIYNAQFDINAMLNSDRAAGYYGQMFEYVKHECVMLKYAQWLGHPSPKGDGYRWAKLPGGDHSAIGDCRATLELIKRMAGDE